MKVASVKEIREFDKRTFDEFGISSEILMENAGNAVYSLIQKHYPIEEKHFSIFCGTGNNGGDGFVVARKLSSAYGNVSVFIVGDSNKITGISRTNLERLKSFPVEIYEVSHVNRFIETSLMTSDVVVDALFGIGLSRKISGIYEDVINEINRCNKFIVSVDIPSGINGDTGEVMGTAVKASCTLTFGLPKRGELQYPGAEYTGKLYVSHISYPPQITESDKIGVELNIPKSLEERKKDGYKGDFGKALFIAGSKRYLGAPFFNSFAFLKSGGGVSYLATVESISSSVATLAHEVITIPLKETEAGTIALKNIESLIDIAKNVDVVAIGSGLAQNEETEELFFEFLKRVDKPLIIDGDGLTMLSKNTSILNTLNNETVLTPHLGEFSRLIKVDALTIKGNKFELLQDAASKLKATIILKGALTLIGERSGKLLINPSGNSGMATAGSGDVLVGVIAAMARIGNSLEQASELGTFLHGLSGDLMAKTIGEDGLISGDILNGIPSALKYFREHYQEIKENNYERARII
jgi:NAD(P)H-hydrate epimerase